MNVMKKVQDIVVNTMNSCNFVANMMKDQIVVNELMTTKEVMKNRIGVASTASTTPTLTGRR